MNGSLDNGVYRGLEKGGIDLTSDKAFQVQKNSQGNITFNLDPAMLQQLQNAPGFVPIIINIQSVPNLKEFIQK